MKQRVTLFVIRGMQDNNKALTTIKRVPSLDMEVIECPKSMQNLFECPFIKDEDDRGYYGLKSIEVFVERLLQKSTERQAEAV